MRAKVRDRLLNLFEGFMLRMSASTHVDGVWIDAFEKDYADILEPANRAMGLIGLYDPVRYRRILKDIKRIWITTVPTGTAEYHVDRDLIVIDGRFAHKASDEVIASVIVHEATHARLKRFGYREADRVRIERCCVRREIAFARRHPSGEEIVQWGEATIPTLEDMYSDEGLHRWHRNSVIETFRELGVPNWLIRMLLRTRDLGTL